MDAQKPEIQDVAAPAIAVDENGEMVAIEQPEEQQ